jgi:pre-rRNA-processing protein TSR3
MKTIILRHRRENLKKCSLRGLEGRPEFAFYTYPTTPLPNLSSYLLLKVGAPPLSYRDRTRGILLLDGTWKLASAMEKQLPWEMEARSLPLFKTAYPRRQTDCPEPEFGLASIEALYVAHKILDYSTENLLDHYYWKDKFLQINDFYNS